MEKHVLLILFFLISCISAYAYDKVATFELKAISEVQNGKIKKVTGNVKQTYILENGTIYLVKSINAKDDYYWTGKDEYKTGYNTTFDKQLLYLYHTL